MMSMFKITCDLIGENLSFEQFISLLSMTFALLFILCQNGYEGS